MNKSTNLALLIDDEPKIRRFLRALTMFQEISLAGNSRSPRQIAAA
jgi:hypothetical protein